MRILDRYLIRGFITSLIYCMILFFILFILIDAFNNLGEFLKHGVTLRTILSYYLYLLPVISVQLVPVAGLVAILYTLGNLSRHNEILAIKASGISASHILAPYLFAGILLSFGIFLLNENVVPQAAITSTSIMEGLIEKGKNNFNERGMKNVTLYGRGNRMIFAREFEMLSQTLYDVVIFESDPHALLQTKITAKRARYAEDQWTFYDVMEYQMNRRGDLVGEPIFSASRVVPLEEKPQDFLKQSSQIEFMNSKQLKEYIEHLAGTSHKLAQKLSVDFHYKIAFPFVCFVVILIGAPLAMRTERAGAMRGIGTSVAVVLLYYGIDSICLALGKGGILPPMFSAWFSNLFFALIGIYLIKNTS